MAMTSGQWWRAASASAASMTSLADAKGIGGPYGGGKVPGAVGAARGGVPGALWDMHAVLAGVGAGSRGHLGTRLDVDGGPAPEGCELAATRLEQRDRSVEYHQHHQPPHCRQRHRLHQKSGDEEGGDAAKREA